MGKAVITANKGDGLYSIQVLYENEILIERKLVVQESITDYTQQKTELEAVLDGQLAVLGTRSDTLNTAIASGTQDDLRVAEQLFTEQRLLVESTQLNLDAITSRLVVLDSELKIVTELEEVYVNNGSIDAWCVEYNEGLTGNIDTIELSDENNSPNNQDILISPIVLPNARKITPVISLLEWSFAYMYMATPVQQHHRPEYREGKITSVDYSADTANVNLLNKNTAITNNGNPYLLNQAEDLVNVPIVYLTCNADVFSANDIVVIEFNRDFNTPVIIGFKSNPPRCDSGGFLYTDISGTRRVLTNQNGIYELEPAINTLVAGTKTSNAGQKFCTFSSDDVFLNGVSIFTSPANVFIVAAAIKEVGGVDILIVFNRVFGATPIQLSYTFYNLGSLQVLNTAVLLDIDELIYNKIAINDSVSEASFLVITQAEVDNPTINPSELVADIVTISINFVTNTCTISSQVQNIGDVTGTGSTVNSYSPGSTPDTGNSTTTIVRATESFTPQGLFINQIDYVSDTQVYYQNEEYTSSEYSFDYFPPDDPFIPGESYVPASNQNNTYSGVKRILSDIIKVTTFRSYANGNPEPDKFRVLSDGFQLIHGFYLDFVTNTYFLVFVKSINFVIVQERTEIYINGIKRFTLTEDV